MVLRTKRASTIGAIVACGVILSSCSLAGPSDHTFTKLDAAESQNAKPATDSKPASKAKPAPQPDKEAMADAARVCKEQTRDKGIKSVLAIISSMRPGAVDEDYITCMKSKGYTVAK